MNQALLSEKFRVDIGDGTFDMENFKRALVFAEGTDGTENTIEIKDNDGNVIAEFDLDDGEMGYFDIHADALGDQDDGEFEVDSADAIDVVVIRGSARYVPVEQSDDVEKTVEI